MNEEIDLAQQMYGLPMPGQSAGNNYQQQARDQFIDKQMMQPQPKRESQPMVQQKDIELGSKQQQPKKDNMGKLGGLIKAVAAVFA